MAVTVAVTGVGWVQEGIQFPIGGPVERLEDQEKGVAVDRGFKRDDGCVPAGVVACPDGRHGAAVAVAMRRLHLVGPRSSRASMRKRRIVQPTGGGPSDQLVKLVGSAEDKRVSGECFARAGGGIDEDQTDIGKPLAEELLLRIQLEG